MMSVLSSISATVQNFFRQITETLGFGGLLAVVVGVEALFILVYGIKSAFSYEARFKRCLDRAFTHR